MIISTDNFPIWLSLIFSFFAMIYYLVSRWNENTKTSKIAEILQILSSILLIYACIYLLQQFLSGNRYDIEYIYKHSSVADPLIYKISGLWAGQEGSMLLWAAMASVFGLFAIKYLRHKTGIPLAIFSLFQFFLVLIVCIEDPFKPFAGFHRGMIGIGLNPVLQNVWMAVHPPVIFLGYAVFILLPPFAVKAAIDQDNMSWAKETMPSLILGWFFLGAGIALGMVWSYEVLGWGGFWAWDPVENASLFPWLIAGALFHIFIVLTRTGNFAKLASILSTLCFILVLFAAFLTRSGILSDFSVHSFADSKTGVYFLITITIAFVIGLITTVKIKNTHTSQLSSKEKLVFIGSIFLIILAVLIFAGTIFPIITGDALNTDYFNTMSSGIAIVGCLILAVSSIIAWKENKKNKLFSEKNINTSIVISAFVSMALIFARAIFNTRNADLFFWFSMLMYSVLVIFLLLVILASLISLFRKNQKISAAISHVGISLLLIGLIISSASVPERLSFSSLQDSVIFKDWNIEFVSKEQTDRNTLNLIFDVKKNNKSRKANLSVEQTREGELRKPVIITTLTGDLYLSPVEISQESNLIDEKNYTLTTTISNDGWLSLPVNIPELNGYFTLEKINVEQKSITISYSKENLEPIEYVITDNQSVFIDDYEIRFLAFLSSEGHSQDEITAGASIAVGKQNKSEKTIIEAAFKPLVWVVWLGLALIVLGGFLSVRNHFYNSLRQHT
ncbi:MAG: cytochrome c biogenesis protein CcsA [Armatimonadota bacterium]